MMVFLKRLFFVTLGLSFLVGSMVMINKSDLFVVKVIHIVNQSGEQNSSEESFSIIKNNVEAKLNSYIGEPIWNVNIDEVIEYIQAEPWIKNVHIRRSLLGEINILIEPKDVAAVLVDKEGLIRSVALDGSILSPVEGQDIPDVPFFTGEDLITSKKLRRRAVEVIEGLPQQGDFSQETISEVFYSAKEGFVVILASDGASVLLGQKSSSQRVVRVNEVLNYLRINSIPVKTIDSRFDTKVVVKRARPEKSSK